MRHNFSIIEQGRMARMHSLGGKCGHCGKHKREFPCERSDHGWTSILMAIDFNPAEFRCTCCAKNTPEDTRSPACREPRTAHAPVLPGTGGRRHPLKDNEDRPVWSGYCVDLNCTCWCHSNEPRIDRNWKGN